MYINKMIFMEANEIGNLETKYGYNVVSQTDYGTNEIIGDQLQNLIVELEAGEDFDFTKEELMEDLNQYLGTDVVKMLLNNELDFIQVIY